MFCAQTVLADPEQEKHVNTDEAAKLIGGTVSAAVIVSAAVSGQGQPSPCRRPHTHTHRDRQRQARSTLPSRGQCSTTTMIQTTQASPMVSVLDAGMSSDCPSWLPSVLSHNNGGPVMMFGLCFTCSVLIRFGRSRPGLHHPKGSCDAGTIGPVPRACARSWLLPSTPVILKVGGGHR